MAVSHGTREHDVPDAAPPAGQGVPPLVRFAMAAAVVGLLAGALYLVSVRGEALLLDLGKLGAIFCM